MFIICYIWTMILQKLFKQVNWTCIWNRMLELYPDAKSNDLEYFSSFNKCIRMTPVSNPMRIVLEIIDGDIEVGGKDGSVNQTTGKEERYALDFTSWDKWMGMEIDAYTRKSFIPVDIVVHCLIEMTFISFDEAEITLELESIKDDIKKIDSGEMKMYTTEEVFSRIREKLNLKED